MEDIISIDETSVSISLTHNYCRAFLGDRCIKKTTNNEVFKKYSLIVAINNKKCIDKSMIYFILLRTFSQTLMTFLQKFFIR